MTVELYCLVENRVYKKGAWGEEGLSVLLIDKGSDSGAVILDCGRSGHVLLHNLELLGLSQVPVETIVLTHGHSGHIGGLKAVLQHYPSARVVFGQGFERQKWKADSDGLRMAGSQRQALESVSPEHRYQVDREMELPGGMRVVRPHAIESGPERADGRYWVGPQGGQEIDTFKEELVLLLPSEAGWVVLTSCGHCGIDLLLRAATTVTGQVPQGIVGGLHLRTDDQALTAGLKLNDFGISWVRSAHCSGKTEAALAASFTGTAAPLTAADSLNLDSIEGIG